jgi:ribonuclease P protein component
MPVIGRLKKRPDFVKVASARDKWVTPGLILQARKRPRPAAEDSERTAPGAAPGPDSIRVGLTVSRKVGNAVRRNRARRRLRAVAEQVLPAHGRAGYDYVLIGRAGTLDRPYAALVKDLETALSRVGRARGLRPAPSRKTKQPGRNL